MGLKESEVKLGVALYLWGLAECWSEPFMTRTADTTVASPAHKQLRADLLARSMASNAVNPDLCQHSPQLQYLPVPRRTILRSTTN